MTPLIIPLGLCLTVITICYISVCAASPWGTCTRCRATGRRTCRACQGTGMRPRIGWQLYAWLRRIHKDGTK